MVEKHETDSNKIATIGNRYLANILGMELGLPDKMEPVIEKQAEQEGKDTAFNVRKYLDSEC